MKHLKVSTALFLAAGAFAVTAAPGEASAQQQNGQEASNAEEIVVTARRRAESLQDVPIAVTAITGAALEAAGVQDITALSERVPNITFEPSRGTNSTLTAFIRGVGQQDPVAGFEQGVGLYLDDVYVNRPQGSVLDVYDVERVEVLRGPQGTLYGRNTIGGAVKYVTRRLNASDPTLRARLNVGSYDQLDAVISGSLPMSDTLRIGGALAGFSREGFGKNRFTGDENYNKQVFAGRISAEWEPSPRFLARIAGDYTRDDSEPRQGYRLRRSALTATDPLSSKFDTNAGITTIGPIDRNEVKSSGYSLTLDWKVADGWTLRSVTAHRKDDSLAPIDFDSTALRTFDVPAIYKNSQDSQELQLIYEGDRINFVGGLYGLRAKAFNGFDAILGAAASLTTGDVRTETWAAFGELTFDITDKLSVTLGGRYTEDTRDVVIVRQTFLGPPSPFFGNSAAVNITAPVVVNGQQVVPRFAGSRTDDAFTPRVILSYEPNDSLTIYGAYAQGFKGGLFDPRGNFANADVRRGVRPEFVDSYELGAKATLFGGRATANTAVFFMDYTDVQIPGSVIVQGPPVSFVGTLTNAGAAELSGIEFEGNAALTDKLSAMLSFGYIDAKYEEFIVNGVNVAAQRKVQNTPDWTGNAGLTYSTPLSLFGRAGAISFNGGASYRGDTQQFETASPGLDQKGYWLYDAGVNWISDDGGLRVLLNGRNLADERYVSSGYFFPTVDASVLAFYGPPRTVTATVELRF